MHSPIKWLDAPEAHNYPAAESYMELLATPDEAAHIVRELGKAPLSQFKAKDILRASQLPCLEPNNKNVAKNLTKITAGKELSPILLVRYRAGGKIIVADGYHRLCAVYHHDEDAWIPCKII